MKEILLENHHSLSRNLGLVWLTRKLKILAWILLDFDFAKNSCSNLAWFGFCSKFLLEYCLIFLGTTKYLESCLTTRFFLQNSQILLDLSKAVLLCSVSPYHVSLCIPSSVIFRVVWRWSPGPGRNLACRKLIIPFHPPPRPGPIALCDTYLDSENPTDLMADLA